MTDNLKTLKDLGRERDIYDMDTGKLKGFDRVLYFNDVKQEAIKWVKEYGWKNPRIDILAVFFEITEEDLE